MQRQAVRRAAFFLRKFMHELPKNFTELSRPVPTNVCRPPKYVYTPPKGAGTLKVAADKM
jgi:hypothetical protein